jgi:hypothetical protein
MYVINNNIKRKLKATASILPEVLVLKREKIQVEGEWLKYSALPGEFKDGEKYWYNQPVWMPVNHFRRLRRLYQSRGFEAVKEYVMAVHRQSQAQLN